MKRIPIERVEKVEAEIPDLGDHIYHARGGKLLFQLEQFENEPELFFDAVWWAASNGILALVESNLDDMPSATKWRKPTNRH